MDLLLTVKAVAALLRVHRNPVYKKARKSDLPGSGAGNIPELQLVNRSARGRKVDRFQDRSSDHENKVFGPAHLFDLCRCGIR
jgi:hypothetical protein